MGEPPVEIGSGHLSSTWLADQSVGSGVPGAFGTAVINKNN